MPLWQERRNQIRDSLAGAPDDEGPGLAERLAFLEQQLGREGERRASSSPG